jgi:hypothetical protein
MIFSFDDFFAMNWGEFGPRAAPKASPGIAFLNARTGWRPAETLQPDAIRGIANS